MKNKIPRSDIVTTSNEAMSCIDKLTTTTMFIYAMAVYGVLLTYCDNLSGIDETQLINNDIFTEIKNGSHWSNFRYQKTLYLAFGLQTHIKI